MNIFKPFRLIIKNNDDGKKIIAFKLDSGNYLEFCTTKIISLSKDEINNSYILVGTSVIPFIVYHNYEISSNLNLVKHIAPKSISNQKYADSIITNIDNDRIVYSEIKKIVDYILEKLI